MNENADNILIRLKEIRNKIINYVDILIQCLEPFLQTNNQSSFQNNIKDIQTIYEHNLFLKKLINQFIAEELTLETVRKSDFPKFLAKVRHDLKNAVNIIKGYTEIVLEDFEKNKIVFCEDKLQEILPLSQQILDLIEEIRTNHVLSTSSTSSKSLPKPKKKSISKEVDNSDFRHFKETYQILVVDDIQENCNIVNKYLKNLGYHNVKFAYDGEQALQIINSQDINLVLLDVDMPKMNGIEVLERLQNKIINRKLMVLMISSSDTMENIIDAIKLGADDFLPKPFNPELLRVRIGSCLEKQWFLSEEMQKRLNTFKKFVPQEFLQNLKKDDWLDVNLGDHVKSEMTVLFSDIRSFTTLSEKMSAEENFAFINEYLNYVYPPIKQNKGFVDKFIGDAVMALFVNSDDAINAGIEMHKSLNEYNDKRVKIDSFPIHIGIGLHKGSLMLGMIGVQDRMQGTVISDAVNLASRIESLTKTFGAALLITHDVMQGNEDKYANRFLGKVVVAGKKEPVNIYEILQAEREEIFSKKNENKVCFEEGLKLYFEKRFSEASVQFTLALKAFPEDKAAQRYLKNSANYMVNGVSDNWDGSEVMSEK